MEHITHAGSLEEQVQDLRKQLSAVIEQNTRLKASMQEESDKEEVEATATKRENERLHKENLSLQEEVQALKDLVCDTTLRASNAEAEVVQLKAKLYDCLMSDIKNPKTAPPAMKEHL